MHIERDEFVDWKIQHQQHFEWLLVEIQIVKGVSHDLEGEIISKQKDKVCCV